VVDADGGVHTALGDIERPIFPRSAVKVLQALPLVASGAADALGLGDEELALACASHGGEALHARTAAGMLAKAGVSTRACWNAARTGPTNEAASARWPRGERPARCTTTARANTPASSAWPAAGRGQRVARLPAGYVQPQHPVMREVTRALQAATGWDLARGGGGHRRLLDPDLRHPAAPPGAGLRARGHRRRPERDHARAARRLRQAVAKAPQMVAGSDRFDTRVMQRLGERVFCKVGAEGVYCAALPERGLGVAMKMDDGNNARAAEVVMAALIEALVQRDDADAALLRG
jgi:L-asparaginase II